MDRKNKIDSHFSDRLSNYSHPYKPELWDDLEGRLNQKTSNKKLIYFAIISLVIVALSGVVFITYVANNKSLKGEQFVNQTREVSENSTSDHKEVIASGKEKISNDLVSDKRSTNDLRGNTKQGDNFTSIAVAQDITNEDMSASEGKMQLSPRSIINNSVIPAEPVWQAGIPLREVKQDNTQADKGLNVKLFSGFHLYGAMAQSRAFGSTRFNTNLVYGLGYHKLFPSKVAFNIEALYIQRKNISISRETHQTRYFLVKEESKTLLVTDRFEYLQIPLYATYPVNDKLSINAGGYMDVLLCSHNVVHKIYDDNETQTTQKGVYKGINYTSGGIMLGVNYELLPRLYIDFRLHKGLYKLLDESYYNNQTNQLTELQFGLRLDI